MPDFTPQAASAQQRALPYPVAQKRKKTGPKWPPAEQVVQLLVCAQRFKSVPAEEVSLKNICPEGAPKKIVYDRQRPQLSKQKSFGTVKIMKHPKAAQAQPGGCSDAAPKASPKAVACLLTPWPQRTPQA